MRAGTKESPLGAQTVLGKGSVFVSNRNFLLSINMTEHQTRFHHVTASTMGSKISALEDNP